MRKLFQDKVLKVEQTAEDVRATVRSVGDAAYSQASLNIALTAVCVTALIVAALLVHHEQEKRGAGRGR